MYDDRISMLQSFESGFTSAVIVAFLFVMTGYVALTLLVGFFLVTVLPITSMIGTAMINSVFARDATVADYVVASAGLAACFVATTSCAVMSCVQDKPGDGGEIND